jgi:hypothetical protein
MYRRYVNSFSNIETLKLLSGHNTNVNLINNNDEIQLFLVKNLRVIKLLLKYGVKINIKNI